MPIKNCTKDGAPGYRWGSKNNPSAKCYTYSPGDKASQERARKRAEKQGAAIEISKHSK